MAVVIKLIMKPEINPITSPIRINIPTDISLAINNLKRLSLETTVVRMVRQLYSLPMELAASMMARIVPNQDIKDNANGSATGSPRRLGIFPMRAPVWGKFALDTASRTK